MAGYYLELFYPSSSIGHPLFSHVGVVDAMQRYEGLLDGLRAGPLEHVVRAPGLVIRPGQPRPAEWLLAHHGPGGLVIDVKVAGGSLQENCSLVSKLPKKVQC